MLGASLSIPRRAGIAAGPLAPLTASLAADLDRLLPDESVFVPKEKARMTRSGGRCARDGALLEFDPLSPRRHRCPACGSIYEGDEHYRWWIMGYQLWLAERAVHAALLWRVAANPRHLRLAESILRQLAERYHAYPNEDNVLGPTRVFFSTYLESIWSLQLSVAVWLLEDGPATSVGDAIRDRVLVPSTELIASFNEGLSNRQVWNSAAIGAAGVLLGDATLVDRALTGTGGLHEFVQACLLEDGTWYEGENYHLFAHRGLWHLVMLAEHRGLVLPDALGERFALGFVAPLRTALPDFTFPSRRDSQYRASLRQWRVAESLELGLARKQHATELAAGLLTMYGSGFVGDAARWRSTAEAERNVPPVRLTRADLGWKSLLFALPDLPEVIPIPAASALMRGQGLGVIRRDGGRVYAALDYGHSGGSHGHPDRLNLWLMNGERRVFEDVGTGSYVERALHWYRSTLAHNAPLVDGRSQRRVSGALRAWEEQDGYSWIEADAAIADGVDVRRSLIAGAGWIIDQVEWNASRPITLDLPLHIDADVEGAKWERAEFRGGSGLEDGFDFLSETETSPGASSSSHVRAAVIDGCVSASTPYDWWRAVAPGPPGEPPRRFILVRARGSTGRISSAWSWIGPIELHELPDGALEVSVAGTRTTHRRVRGTWCVESGDGSSVMLDGRDAGAPARTAPREMASRPETAIAFVRRDEMTVGDLLANALGTRFDLGERHYRRTEATWREAGGPTATVMVAATPEALLVEVTVDRVGNFAPARDVNPLDNEHPDTNSDGVQLHLAAPGGHERKLDASWLLVPEADSGSVRVTARDDAPSIPLSAAWRRTSTGWQLLARLPRAPLGVPESRFDLGVIVNEMPAGRERRRGQLVLGAPPRGPEWAYLRGDRQDRDNLVPMRIPDDRAE